MITIRGDRGGGAQRPPQRDCLRHGRGRGGGTPALGARGQHLNCLLTRAGNEPSRVFYSFSEQSVKMPYN